MECIEKFKVYLVTPSDPEGKFIYSTLWFNEEEFNQKVFKLDENRHMIDFTPDGMEIYDEVTDETVARIVAVKIDR